MPSRATETRTETAGQRSSRPSVMLSGVATPQIVAAAAATVAAILSRYRCTDVLGARGPAGPERHVSLGYSGRWLADLKAGGTLAPRVEQEDAGDHPAYPLKAAAGSNPVRDGSRNRPLARRSGQDRSAQRPALATHKSLSLTESWRVAGYRRHEVSEAVRAGFAAAPTSSVP